jgi:hypothetical protein
MPRRSARRSLRTIFHKLCGQNTSGPPPPGAPIQCRWSWKPPRRCVSARRYMNGSTIGWGSGPTCSPPRALLVRPWGPHRHRGPSPPGAEFRSRPKRHRGHRTRLGDLSGTLQAAVRRVASEWRAGLYKRSKIDPGGRYRDSTSGQR